MDGTRASHTNHLAHSCRFGTQFLQWAIFAISACRASGLSGLRARGPFGWSGKRLRQWEISTFDQTFVCGFGMAEA